MLRNGGNVKGSGFPVSVCGLFLAPQPEAALRGKTILRQHPLQFRQRRMQLVLQRVGRVDDDEAGAGKAGRFAVAANRKLGTEHFGDLKFLERLMEGRDRRTLLDRVPQAIDAGRKPPPCSGKPINQPVVFPIDLERRIDQNDAALFLRRQVRTERQPAVEFGHAHLIVALEKTRQSAAVVRVKFHRGQTVLRAKEHARKLR